MGSRVNTTMSSWAMKQPEDLGSLQTPEAGRTSRNLLLASTMSNASFDTSGTTYATPEDNKGNTVVSPIPRRLPQYPCVTQHQGNI